MTTPSSKARVNSIDILRGIIMVIMALDHVRDYFSGFKFEPTDLQHASTIMFFTRWITHFCAPVFIFLSGTSAFLSMKGRSTKQEAWRLLTRGLWLIVLEHTIVRFGWVFDLNYSMVFIQVIWAIGVSMIVLAGLIFLPRWLILFIGLAMIFLHNLLDNVHNTSLLWQLLHVQSMHTYAPGKMIFIIYPLIPWVGVMAVGFCFGALFIKPEAERNRWLYGIGMWAIVLFIIIRFTNAYGDPSPWAVQSHHSMYYRTILSFINCSKYPPSLLYLLMTIGPAIGFMPLLERMSGAVGGIFKVYGRVPLFYYILHIYLIHGMAVISSYFFNGGAHISVFEHPAHRLPVVYGVWVLAVVILYFPCRWFMRIKQNHHKWWLSYL